MSFTLPTRFNSYGAWRKACNYTKEQNYAFTNLIASNSNHTSYDIALDRLLECIQLHIAPNDLLICLLYLSCHHYSPHATKLIKYLLINYSLQINLCATSISSPQFQIPHIAATNGDINAPDGRGVLPVTMSVSERELQFCECLLWMNSKVPIRQVSMLEDRRKEDVAAFIAAFMHFMNVIEESQNVIGKSLKFPKELIEVVVDYTLPMNACHGVCSLLDSLESKRANEWNQIKEIAFKKLFGNIEKTKSILVGIDFENEQMGKMWTQIYVEPTRNKDGAFRLGTQYNRKTKDSTNDVTLKLLLMCSIALSSAIIVYKHLSTSKSSN